MSGFTLEEYIFMLGKIVITNSYLLGIILIPIGIYRILKKKNYKKTLIFLFAGVILIFCKWYSIHSYQLESVQEYRENAKKIDFDLFVPNYLPSDYKIDSLKLLNPLDYSGNTEVPNLQASYRDNKWNYFFINEFEPNSPLDPPKNCNPISPTQDPDDLMPCRLIGVSSSGDNIYFSSHLYDVGSYGDDYFFIQKGRTRIALQIPFPRSHVLSNEDIIQIINSLHPVSTNKLDFFMSDLDVVGQADILPILIYNFLKNK